ncbi:MAG: hypothetical protein RSA29_14060 [Clostridium sp.]|uniref:hypothetical protein n=1 Tax=Clostridium sp. TaxID=1506 RepID=UPI003051F81F
MLIFKLITVGLVAIYGGLSLFAAFMGLRGGETRIWANLSMGLGSILIILGPFIEMYKGISMNYVLILGLLLIHIATISHDYRIFNGVSIRPNIVRICISSIILIIYYKGYIR